MVKRVNRRDFIISATSAAGCVLSCDALAQPVTAPQFAKALDDSNVIHGSVTFPSGSVEIDGYLARPRKKGRYPVVIVITGNSVSEEYIRNTPPCWRK